MRPWFCSVVIVGAVLLASLAADQAAAGRASCEELLEALDTGRSLEEVAAEYGTTQARLEACTRVAIQRERFAEQRDRFDQDRADRGLNP